MKHDHGDALKGSVLSVKKKLPKNDKEPSKDQTAKSVFNSFDLLTQTDVGISCCHGLM